MTRYFRGSGGRAIYGVVFGIISNDTLFPRIPGDSGNASTYPFPTVIKAVVQPIKRIVKRDPDLLKQYLETIREFEKIGVKAVTTVCGFNILFQKQLTESANVPVFASSLMQLPLIQRILPKGQKIGVLTADGKAFNDHREELLACAGLEPSTPIAIEGMEGMEGWSSSILENKPTLDQEKIEEEIVEVARGMVSKDHNIGAICFECHNMPPYSRAVRDSTGRPVFDILTLVDMIYNAIVKKRYRGII